MGVFLVFAISMLQLVLPHLFPLVATRQNPTNITTPSPLMNGVTLLLTPTQHTFWVSPTNVFALGFLETPSSNSSAAPSFTLSLFYSSLSQFQLTPVWTPHRGRLLTQNAILNFTAQGDLLLSDSGEQIWHTGTTGVTSVLVSDQGYISLSGKNSAIVWRSWDVEPITDTLLPGQALASGTDVVDNKGRYLLRVQNDSHSVLYFLGSLNQQTTNYYWASHTLFMNVTQAYYNASQGLVLINDKAQTVKVLLQSSLSTKLERIVLSESGTLIRYMLSADGKSWLIAAQVPSSICYVPGLCGPYGICMDDQQNISTSTGAMDSYYCTCPDGFYYIDPNDSFAGCGTNYPLDCTKGSKLTSLPGVQYGATYSSSTPEWQYHYSNDLSTLDQCVQSCNSSCQCAAATYDGENCHLSTLGQVNSGNMQTSTYVTFLKTSVSPSGNSSHTYSSRQATGQEGHTRRVLSITTAVGVGAALGFAGIAGFANLAWWYHTRSNRQANMNDEQDVEVDEDEQPLLGGGPIQFSYKELKAASNGFKSLLGRGGFGPVYKGVLAGGAQIAIKRLQGSTFGEKQFRAEIMTIGSVHHMNLVRLQGYCAKGAHRMLVYEFLPRGSLNRYIFLDSELSSNFEGQAFLDWETRFQILLSTARAIRYLHEECQPSIVHCDIKPGNILLGEAFNAKVSDFGMAQLMGGDAGHTGSVTRMRGTLGYMAPEWASSKHITTKVDVYSFGIVVLEVITGRHVIDIESESKVFLERWVYSQVLKDDAALQVLDPRLHMQITTNATQHAAISPQLFSTSTNATETVGLATEGAAASGLDDIAPGLERAVWAALWCIHKDPAMRPSMGLVVQFLEGIMPMDPPPYPF